MILVNKDNPIPEGWEETVELIKFRNSQGYDILVESTAYDAYLELKDALEDVGIYVDLVSAYRSIEEQQRIWDEYTEIYGEEYVREYVAVPGYSEHHTGLALDIYLNIDDRDVYLNEELVMYQDVWAKIHEMIADYGFILRYMEGKTEVTGYGYEPWHIRYVGVDAAKEIMAKGISLEEYMDIIAQQ